MKMFRNSIGAKLITIVVGVVLLSISVTTATSLHREVRNFNGSFTAELLGTAQILASSVASPLANNDKSAVQGTLTAIARLDNILLVRVETPDLHVVAEMGQAVILPDRNLSSDADASLLVLLKTDTLSARVPVIKGGEIVGSLTIYRNVRGVRSDLLQLISSALLVAFGASLIGICCAWVLQRRILKPVNALAGIMAQVRKTDNFSLTAEKTTNDEVAELVESFNAMLANIRERDDKLTDHRRNLEKTVQKRTWQYRKARDKAVEANAAKSDFLATMSHEIRTPMNGIMVMAELLSTAELSLRHQRYADVIVNSGQSLLSIINDILDLSKIEAGKMELEETECNPAAIAGDVLNLFAEKAASKKIGLAAYVAPEVPKTVLGDPVRINQVLSNLVNNAIKFTEKGNVRINVLPCHDQPDMLKISVEDTGIGISEDKITKVFDAFSQADQSTTREFGGTGLGLSICQKLVAAMEGTIGVTSEEGQGSTFFFTLKAPVIDPAPTMPDLVGRKIIIHSEQPVTGEVVAELLADYGAQVMTDMAKIATLRVLPDFIIAEPRLLRDLPDAFSPSGRICLGSIGDNDAERLVNQGEASDILFQPVLPGDLQDLASRMASGQLRGKAALISTMTEYSGYDFTGCRALVADDSAVNREVIMEAMRTLKVSVETVENGHEAVAACAEGRFDIIFMDCSMPVMDGYEATRQIRQNEGDEGRTPIVALTAQMAGMSDEVWKKAGMDGLITKPFKLETLGKAIAAYVGFGQPAEPVPIMPLGETPPLPVTRFLDEEVLLNLREMGAASGKDLSARALAIFAGAAPASLKRIAEAITDKNLQALSSAAHALKSMSYNSGALPLAEACSLVEKRATAGEMVQEEMAALIFAYEGTLQEIDARQQSLVA